MQESTNPLVAPGTAEDRGAVPQPVALSQLFEQFHTSDRSLTSQEARRRLSEVGPNELGKAQRIAGIRQRNCSGLLEQL